MKATTKETVTKNHNEAATGRMPVQTKLKAGGLKADNHNETLVGGMPVRTKIKAGRVILNHNETLVVSRPLTGIHVDSDTKQIPVAVPSLPVQTEVKAGLKIKRSD